MPVHHTNEIAETFAAYGCGLSRYWLHCNFITIDGEKVSKSLGNVYTLDDLAERGFAPMDFKMWVLSGHYQGTRNFTFESLEAARARRLHWRNRIALCYQSEVVGEEGAWEQVLAAVNDNLNSPEAFAIIDNSELSFMDWEKIDNLFGLNLILDSPDLPEELRKLILERERMRANKNFAQADKVRDKLLENEIAIRDTVQGSIWEYES